MKRVAKAEFVMEAFQRFKKSRQSFAEKKLSKMHQKWSPHPADVVKVNVEATIVGPCRSNSKRTVVKLEITISKSY